jgi:transposase
VVRHIGSGRSVEELAVLLQEAEIFREEISCQPSLFGISSAPVLLHAEHLNLQSVTHHFALNFLRKCFHACGLEFLPLLYQDFALMRIIEPASKLRTLELLARYFSFSYSRRTLHRLLPKFIEQKTEIEAAAYATASKHFSEKFAFVLYDVTTLYFETHKPDDELQARGFSKDDKSKQPQIVVGLLVTLSGFPIRHEIFKGNTFEGHTMLEVVREFQKIHQDTKPIIVADAAMLSLENLEKLAAEGYQYIVGARLANAPIALIEQISAALERSSGASIRLPYPRANYEIVCTYSEKRARKDRREFEKQLIKAEQMIARKELGKRTKFVKKSANHNDALELNEMLKNKTEKLLGIKGYATNIPDTIMSNAQIASYYNDLWHVEQSFRMSKSDLKTRPIFHHKHEAIKAHVLLCFVAMIIGKFLELKTNMSIRKIRDTLWNVHEATITDTLTGKNITLQGNLTEFKNSKLAKINLSH